MPIVMTPRDEELISVLTRKVRVITADQAGRCWWPHGRSPGSSARRLFSRLESQGWLHVVSVSARPELQLLAPITSWAVDDPPPDFGAVAHRLKSRWTEPLQRTIVAVATERAEKRFGGRGGPLTHPLQVSHDLHVTTLFLRLRSERPHAISQWIPEHEIARTRRHAKLPDAAIGKSPTQIRRIIEFGNGYDRHRVAAFHADCAERQVPYEIW